MKHIVLLLVVGYSAVMAGEAADSTHAFSFLPGKKIFPLFTADALTHQISLSKIIDNRDWIGTIGGVVPLVTAHVPKGPEIQFSVAVSTFNRLIKPPGLTVYTIDYKIDVPVDIRYDRFAVRLAYGHYSCHFADDGIEILGRHSIQSIKDHLWMGVAYDLEAIGGYTYAAGFYFYHNAPQMSAHWQVQWGAEGGNLPVTEFAKLYAAIDIKCKQEVNWGTTRSLQIGLRMFEHRNYSLRLAYVVRRGYDERGQFFDMAGDANMFSLFLDL